jgi:hypothetical protein
MYSPLNSADKSAAQNANDAVNSAQLTAQLNSPDGLIVSWKPDPTLAAHAIVPPRLHDWLIDIRLLKKTPLSYMVPDPALLPPESIRFFYVDPTWTSRLTDGLFAAADTGSVDIAFSTALNQIVRGQIDKELSDRADAAVSMASGGTVTQANWSPAMDPMTGMLIRSQLVRRWPDLIITAYGGKKDDTNPIGVLRAEPISKDIYIALFAGEPHLIQIKEPHVALRFGVEHKSSDAKSPDFKNYVVPLRDEHGESIGGAPQDVFLKSATTRVIKIAELATASAISINTRKKPNPPVQPTSRTIALQLERRPYRQDFVQADASVPESRGLQPNRNPDGTLRVIALRNGRVMSTIATLAAREDRMKELGKL